MWQEIFFLVHLIYALINSLEYSGGHVSSEAGLTDDRLTVVTSNVVPFNTITVEVVEHPKTVFVALTVVWLWSAEPGKPENDKFSLKLPVIAVLLDTVKDL